MPVIMHGDDDDAIATSEKVWDLTYVLKRSTASAIAHMHMM